MIRVPTLGDIETVATIVGENSSRTPTPLAATGQVPLNVYTFDSRPLQVSIEAAQDMVGALNLMTWAESVFASRLARGIGKKLVNGSGSGEPFGILSALEGIGVTPVTAAGSANNTGDNTQTGANSIGSADLANLIGALDSAYLASSKAAFMMNRNTLAFLNGLVSKMGTLIGLVQYVNGQPNILGLPVKISPTLPNIGASTTPILVGDFSYWCTRLVNAGNGKEQIGIYNYSETTDVVGEGCGGSRGVHSRRWSPSIHRQRQPEPNHPAPDALVRSTLTENTNALSQTRKERANPGRLLFYASFTTMSSRTSKSCSTSCPNNQSRIASRLAGGRLTGSKPQLLCLFDSKFHLVGTSTKVIPQIVRRRLRISSAAPMNYFCGLTEHFEAKLNADPKLFLCEEHFFATSVLRELESSRQKAEVLRWENQTTKSHAYWKLVSLC